MNTRGKIWIQEGVKYDNNEEPNMNAKRDKNPIQGRIKYDYKEEPIMNTRGQ